MKAWAKQTQYGFTIVELLIVIVVIGILAAITIVAFNGIQDRAHNSAVENDIAVFQKKIEAERIVASDGLYPSPPTVAMGLRFSKDAYMLNRNNLYYCVSTDRTQYAFGAQAKTGMGYIASSTASLSKGASVAVNDANTCAVVGRPNGSHAGLNWNGTTNTWSVWTN